MSLSSEESLVEAQLCENGIFFTNGALPFEQEDRNGASLWSQYCGPYFKIEDSSPVENILFEDILWCSKLSERLNYSLSLEYDITFMNCLDRPELSRRGVVFRDAQKNMLNKVLEKSYSESIVSPRILVVINSHSGKGNALQIYKSHIEPVLQAAHSQITRVTTEYSKHGIEIGRNLNIDEFDIIACCSGDGTVHEIINGIFQREDRQKAFDKLAITQLPCGSGNALALSTLDTSDPMIATLRMLKAHRKKIDLMAVTQGSGIDSITKLSFLSQCYGIIADADIGTDYLRWMGPVRFEIGVVKGLLSRSTYPCDLFVKYEVYNKNEIKRIYRDYNHESTGTNLSNIDESISNLIPLDAQVPSGWTKISDRITQYLNVFYVGNMPVISRDAPFFPAALPNDGHMDMIITDTNSSIIQTTSMLFNVERGKHIDDDKVMHFKISGYRLVPKVQGNHYISIDGEDFPLEPLQVQVIPGVMNTLLHKGKYTETSMGSSASQSSHLS